MHEERFPLQVASGAIRQYAGPRCIEINGTVSEWRSVGVGIMPGCGVARYALRCYLTEPAQKLQDLRSQVDTR
eukprot:6561223-Alexandrium_andersonii.AAC.1